MTTLAAQTSDTTPTPPPGLEAAILARKGKRQGQEIKFCCPAHDDTRPSASWNPKKYLWKCHVCGEGGGWLDLAKRLNVTVDRPARMAPAARETLYRYTEPDNNGAEVVRAIHKRLDLPNGEKRLTWLSADGTTSGGRVKMADLPLYGIADLLVAPPDQWVYLVEGEKAADAGRRHGLVTVTNAGGASQSDFGKALEPLAGRKVVLLPDNDDAGRTLMRRVYAALRGKAEQVRVVELGSLPEKGDLFDFFAQGGTTEEVEAAVASAAQTQMTHLGINTFSAAQLLAKHFSESRPIVARFLYEGLMILAGRAKQGKSWLMLKTAIAVAMGGVALGQLAVHGGDVLYVALEDGEKRLQSRLTDLLGGDAPPARLHFAVTWPALDAGGLEALDLWIAGHPNARLVILDTLKRIRPKEVRGASFYGQDYDALAPIADLAKKYGICIVVVHHTKKGDAEDPLDLISGTTGLTAAGDGAIVLKRVRGEADATLKVVHRDVDDCELALRWDALTFGWVVSGEADDLKRSPERNKILCALHDAGVPLGPLDTSIRTGLPHGSVKVLMPKMHQNAELKSNGRGGYTPLVPRPTLHNTINPINSLTTPDGSGPAAVNARTAAVNSTRTTVNPSDSKPPDDEPPPVNGLTELMPSQGARKKGVIA